MGANRLAADPPKSLKSPRRKKSRRKRKMTTKMTKKRRRGTKQRLLRCSVDEARAADPANPRSNAKAPREHAMPASPQGSRTQA
jgi:hypothetical protein